MNTIAIPKLKKTFEMPADLSECNSRQYVQMCDLLYKYMANEIDFFQFRYAAVYRLLDLRIPPVEMKQTDSEKMKSNIYQLSELIDDFFYKREDKLLIKQDFQHNPIKQVKIGKQVFYGPEDFFMTTNFDEYVDGLNVFSGFSNTGNIDLLYDLMAIFYRPKNEGYDAKTSENRKDVFKKINFGYVYGFLLFFASFQYYLTESTVTYEGKEIDLSILFKTTTKNDYKSPLASLGMKSTAYMLAETGVLGNLTEVNKTNLWEVVFLMYNIKKNDMDELARMKKNNQ